MQGRPALHRSHAARRRTRRPRAMQQSPARLAGRTRNHGRHPTAQEPQGDKTVYRQRNITSACFAASRTGAIATRFDRNIKKLHRRNRPCRRRHLVAVMSPDPSTKPCCDTTAKIRLARQDPLNIRTIRSPWQTRHHPGVASPGGKLNTDLEGRDDKADEAAIFAGIQGTVGCPAVGAGCDA